jgi:hypothetical protein
MAADFDADPPTPAVTHPLRTAGNHDTPNIDPECGHLLSEVVGVTVPR